MASNHEFLLQSIEENRKNHINFSNFHHQKIFDAKICCMQMLELEIEHHKRMQLAVKASRADVEKLH